MSKKRKKPLTYFGVEVTRRCNLSCPHCFTSSTSESEKGPTTEKLKELMGDLVDAGATHIAFSGGEPLLRKDLEEVMHHGKSLGIKGFSMVTNGFLANQKRVATLKRAGMNAVQVSVDGVDARDHCTFRQCSPLAYYRALRAVRVFREAGIVVDIAMILTDNNAMRAPEMLLLCESLGARSLRLCSFVATGRGTDPEVAKKYELGKKRADEFLELMRRINSDKRSRIGMVIDHGIGPWKKSGAFHCSAGEDVVYIAADGSLYPCPGLIHEPFKVGNVFETPIKELLDSPELSRVRTMSKEELAEPCKTCTIDLCSGGCRGAVYAATGDIHGAVSYCNARRRGLGQSSQ